MQNPVDIDQTPTPPDPPRPNVSLEYCTSIGALTSALADLLTSIILLILLILDLIIRVTILMLSLTARSTLVHPTCSCGTHGQPVDRSAGLEITANDIASVRERLTNPNNANAASISSPSTTALQLPDTTARDDVSVDRRPDAIESAPESPTNDTNSNSNSLATSQLETIASNVTTVATTQMMLQLPSAPASIVIAIPRDSHLAHGLTNSTPSVPCAPLPPYAAYDPQEHLHGLNLHELRWEDLELDADELAELAPGSAPVPDITRALLHPPSLAYNLTESSYVPGVLGQSLNAPVPATFQTPASIDTRHMPLIDRTPSSSEWFVVPRGLRIGVFGDWYVV